MLLNVIRLFTVLLQTAGKTGQVHRSSLSTVSRLRQETGREIVNTQIFMNVHTHTGPDRSLMCLPPALHQRPSVSQQHHMGERQQAIGHSDSKLARRKAKTTCLAWQHANPLMWRIVSG